MKKRYYFLFALPLFFFSEKTAAQGAWAVGLHFGENLTSLTGDADSAYRLGFVAGAHASHYLTKNIVLRLEANYERKGTETTLPPNPFGPEVPAEIQLDYLTLPVLLRYSTAGRTKFIAGGGMAVSYLLEETTTFENVNAVMTDDFKRVDADLVLCTGVGIPFGENFTFGVEFRSIFGLVDVSRKEGTARQLGRNVAWGVLVGVNYYL